MHKENLYLKMIRLGEVTSTNDYAHQLADKGEREITVILAQNQRKGKGRWGRNWVSSKNKGLYVSFLFRPNKELKKIQLLGMVIALAVVEALEKIITLKIKWPNDLVVNNKKIGGILIETASSCKTPPFVIAGLGLNINNDPSQMPKEATSLLLEKGKAYSIEKVFKLILKKVIIFYTRFKGEDFSFIIEAVTKKLDTIGKNVKVRTHEKNIEGIACAIDKYGALIIKDAKNKSLKVFNSEVIRLR